MITKETLANYKYLEKCIEETREKIKKLEKRQPLVVYDKVYGSSSDFPYTVRGFKISGYNSINADKWAREIDKLKAKLKKDLESLQQMKLEIENFIADIPKEKAFEKLIFTYIYSKGMSQTEAAMKLNIDQSNISRKITDYLKVYNESCI